MVFVNRFTLSRIDENDGWQKAQNPCSHSGAVAGSTVLGRSYKPLYLSG